MDDKKAEISNIVQSLRHAKSMSTIAQLIEEWKKKLLDLSKRNNLLNFRTTRRGTLTIAYPDFDELYSFLTDGDELQFAKPSQEEEFDLFGEEGGGNPNFTIKSTAASLKEESTTLRGLRRRAKTIMEEQGINVLYVAFGIVRWKESDDAPQEFTSPLVLVPVTLSISSVVDPYVLSFNDDEITVNPTLVYKLEHDFGLKLPEYDDSKGIEAYLQTCEALFNDHPGWSIERSAYLSIFSFLKINMYYDLSKSLEAANENAIIQAFSGDMEGLSDQSDILRSMEDIDYDKDINPKNVFQVLDADTSQQEAIELAKRGASFVLQGPPGTGKSQTITNIIAESLAAGKTVLFVSEKEAALNVVKHRLDQTHILDFCLPMHSHKANKKEIITELYRTAELGRERVKEDALIQLDKLYGNRLKLDQLSEEIHRPIAPLNQSVFEVNGELASREQIPHFLFPLDDVQEYNKRKLHDVLEKIVLLTTNAERFNGDRFSPLWNDCKLPTLSNENRYTFKASITPALSADIQKVIDKTTSLFASDVAISWAQFPQFVEFLSHCARGENMPVSWLSVPQDELESTCKEWAAAFEEIHDERTVVEEHFQDNVYQYNSALLLRKVDALRSIIENQTKHTIDGHESETYRNQLLHLSQDGKEVTGWVSDILLHLKLVLPQGYDLNGLRLRDLGNLVEAIRSLVDAEGANREWYCKPGLEEVENLLSEIDDKRREEKSERDAILADFDKEIFSVDANGLLPKFRTNYSSIFRVFNSEYKQDLNKLIGVSKRGKISYKEALSYLTVLKSISDMRSWYSDNAKTFAKYFSSTATMESVDIEAATKLAGKVRTVIDYFNGAVPESIKMAVTNGFYQRRETSASVELLSMLLESKIYQQQAPLVSKEGDYCTLQQLASTSKKYSEAAEAVLNEWEELETYATDSLPSLSVLTPLMKWQTFLGGFDAAKQDLTKLFRDELESIDTDWSRIARKLTWLKTLKTYREQLIPKQSVFYTEVLSDENKRKQCAGLIDLLESTKTAHNGSIVRFNQWFPDDHSIMDMPLPQMLKVIDHYQQNLDYLEGWLAYRKVYRELRDMGLTGFLQTIVDKPEIPAADYKGIFDKRFYSVWLDYAKNQLPGLSGISQIELETLLGNFKNLDTNQFTIAQARIREILSEKLPNVNVIASANDQLGILRHEYFKQRRQMPIRKLFNCIPELVLRLKPCLMMSPLSVSLFLENPGYVFDVVIFDEASQVKPENAIGSIIRGKQVIVAGDTHQLPPTNFFQANLSDDDLYDDDTEEDIALEESILDSCARVLPERYLKWHYRSRDEHLIAFSNAKIYDSRLTTFPSAVDHETDLGVEYVLVPDGVYERGGKKNNPKEAEKVADLVFEHFKKHPDRTLGIIANSDSQARTIEDIVNRRRAQHPRFESFFSEERDEPFFVKSLESVQGDERDTIIFSVGYGKDANGRMTQNFGPINRDGGERRLNVAVTRAKFNFKLVASIGADAIEVTDSTKDGPKTLKAYIDYAQRGIVALTGELEEGHELQFDSPFEESVYNFLTENGYNVATQVGCAGYRIDMGVKDPENPGRYVLAVECDGATYHSSQYARERDRLRQQVLENMGWHFHRIWSTEWIQATAAAKNSLLQAVQAAIFNAPKGGQLFEPTEMEPTVEALIDKVEEEQKFVGLSTVLDFDQYVFAELKSNDPFSDVEKVRKVIAVEGPVHYNYLARKMAPFMGFSRASSTVKRRLDWYLAHLSKELERKDDFIYLKPVNPVYKMRIISDRDITEICPEELEYAMVAVANNTIGITEDLLIEETAHNIGFVHAKSKLKARLKTIFDSLVACGKLKVLPSGSVMVC